MRGRRRVHAEHGRDPQTPVAVIRWGTRPGQQVVTGTVADIAARAAHLGSPAITVVGEVVSLRDRLNWFERLPLFGKRIAVTRSREQAGTLRAELAALGAEVVEIPTIEIHPPASWEPLDAAIERVGLGQRVNTAARQLSAGQRRRLGLAWLLVRRPELWLLDEPYASLDNEGRSFFDTLLGDVIASGATVVVSAHDPLRSEALHPRTLVMAGGRIVGEQS